MDKVHLFEFTKMILRDKYDSAYPYFNGKPVHPSLFGQAFWDAYDLTFKENSSQYNKNKQFYRWFNGKLGELILWFNLKDNKNFICFQPGHYINYCDSNGDDGDIKIRNIKTNKDYWFSVKTTFYTHRLLTEQVYHYNEDGIYKPGEKDIIFDRHYIVRLNQDVSKLDVYKDPLILYEDVIKLDWKYDIPGYMTHQDFLEVIRNKHIINKGELNHRSDVYFVHQCDLNKINFKLK